MKHKCAGLAALAPDGGIGTTEENSVREVLGQWQAVGIPYCMLRHRPEHDRPDGDLDLLIEESWVERCRQWLEEHEFLAGPSPTPFKMVMLRYRRGQALCLDIHWKAVQYGIVYMDERRMIDRRVESDGLFHLSVEDELIHLVLHNFLRKGPLRPAALQRIRYLLNASIDRPYLDDHLDAFGLRSAFEAAAAWVQHHETDTENGAGVRRRLFWAALRARPGNIPRHLSVRCHARPSASRRGGFVALVGPDGSGKSTVVKAIVKRAPAIPNVKIETTYLGPWGQMRLPLVPALRRAGITPTVQPLGPHVATRAGRDGASRRLRPHQHVRPARSARARFGSLAKGCVFYGAIYIELLYRYMTSVFVHVRRGRWVVADRYITDLRYLYKERPIKNYGAIRRLLCTLFPKPDLLIVLDNRPDVIVSRKSGLAVGQIEVLRRSCLRAARAYRFEIITTDHTPDEIADHVLKRVLALRAMK